MHGDEAGSHTALGPSIGSEPTQTRLQQKLKLSPTFSLLAGLFLTIPCPHLPCLLSFPRLKIPLPRAELTIGFVNEGTSSIFPDGIKTSYLAN